MSTASDLCRLEDCERPVHLKRDKLCNAHYLQQRKGREFSTTRQTVPAGNATCGFPGCVRRVSAKGWCTTHYRQQWEGKPLTPIHTQGFTPYSAVMRDGSGRKRCSRCYAWKAEAEYASDAKRIDGYQGQCRTCMADAYAATTLRERRYRHLKKYNLTPERFDALLASQDGGCATCGASDSGQRHWAVDHDHTCCPGKGSCGKCVRGLLCGQCNTALGLVKDNPETLRAMIGYLER